MAIHVVNEAKRCLNCKVPQCKKACPVSTAIPEFIQLFLQNRLTDAGELLFKNNPLSVICSLVCDHEKQCEGHCVLGKKGTPVHISSIENYISDTYLNKLSLTVAPSKGKKVAIIGTGPAGITISVVLAQWGYDITLFESRDKIGGVLRYGIPDFRLPKTILDRYKCELIKLGIKIRPNTTIGGALTADDLFRDGYRAIFIGTGVWRPNTLGVRGESLSNVHYAIDYLVNPDVYNLGESVAVIGAGNSAMDVARTVVRKGTRRVTVFSRSEKAAASTREVEYAMADGIEFGYGLQVKELTEQGPIFTDVITGAEERFYADSTIIAISQGPKDKIVSSTQGLRTNERGLLLIDQFGHTTREGIFASGDVVKGARTVVEAVKYSKEVAEAMDDYLSSI